MRARPGPSPPRWFTASYRENGGARVEGAADLAVSRGVVPVRDSKAPGGPALTTSVASFSCSVAGVKAGEFAGG
ncbi:DUF397 domain-containing protein [Streptomyces sp. NPDC057697]|uniref:DUF397 domain-containing protein n=1 Tax=Streptomyces sp. NPDC057697 TaxID=3346219 RepID=UPI0036948488